MKNDKTVTVTNVTLFLIDLKVFPFNISCYVIINADKNSPTTEITKNSYTRLNSIMYEITLDDQDSQFSQILKGYDRSQNYRSTTKAWFFLN